MTLDLGGTWDYRYSTRITDPLDNRLPAPLTFEPVTPDRYRATYTDPNGRVSTYEATVYRAARGDTVSIVQSSPDGSNDYFSTMCASADHDVLAGYWCDVGGVRGQFTMEKIAP